MSYIEYYGINVIGDIEEFDYMLMEKYPDRIKNCYSKTKNKIYLLCIFSGENTNTPKEISLVVFFCWCDLTKGSLREGARRSRVRESAL